MTVTTPVESDAKVQVRVEVTETRLSTEYYDIDAKDLPPNWHSMNQDEQHVWIRARGNVVKNNVEEIQERTDGVFLSWEKSHPEWTVTFTYTQSEIVSAANREAAINKARMAIARTYDDPDGAIQVLGDADVDVLDGRWGL
jgi:hypothetical protein